MNDTHAPTRSRLEDLMRQEIVVFEAFQGEQKAFNAAVMERDWETAEGSRLVLAELSAGIEAVEAERHRAYQACLVAAGLPPDCEFSGYAECQGEELRRILMSLHSRLRFLALSVKAGGAALGEFVAATREAYQAVIGELFPQRRGRTYSRKGARVERSGDPLILNRSV